MSFGKMNMGDMVMGTWEHKCEYGGGGLGEHGEQVHEEMGTWGNGTFG